MSGFPLKISEQLAGRIRAHGVETYPYECCGAILGRDGEAAREVLDLIPLANRRDDSPRNRFEVTSEDVRLAEKAARAQNLRADRLVSFAPGSSSPPQRVRSRSRVALVQLHHRQRAIRSAARHEFLAAARRPFRLRPRGH